MDLKLSVEDRKKYRKDYKDNPKVIAYLDDMDKAELEEQVRAKTEFEATLAREQAIADFEAKILGLADLPKPPDTIHNIYLAWREVMLPVAIPEGTSEARIAELKANPSKVWKWVVEVNHADKAIKASGETAINSGKRAITVYKRSGSQLESLGNFHSGSKACDYLNLDYAGNSAIRVLRDNSYIIEAYTGTDFIDK